MFADTDRPANRLCNCTYKIICDLTVSVRALSKYVTVNIESKWDSTHVTGCSLVTVKYCSKTMYSKKIQRIHVQQSSIHVGRFNIVLKHCVIFLSTVPLESAILEQKQPTAWWAH